MFEKVIRGSALAVAVSASLMLPACKPAKVSVANVNQQGLEVFNNRCAICHSINGVGGKRGPDLAMLKDPDLETIKKYVRSPRSVNPNSRMMGLKIDDEPLNAVAETIVQINGKK